MASPAEQPSALSPRQHIQNFSDPEATFEPHWGYAERVLPCKNDKGSCEYLDEVYGAHDVGMRYMGIFWGSLLALLLVWGIARRFSPPRDDSLTPRDKQRQSTLTRLRRALASTIRRRLLPNAPISIFGHTTRLQVAILAILIGYVTILSFAGITYKIWRTPIAGQPAHVYNTRSSLGPWADRVGVIAYALTPLSVVLAMRDNLVSHVTGVPYTTFLFLHRWTGYLILVQSIAHTIGWVIIEAKLYLPQPTVWLKFSRQLYAIWGFVALGLLVLIWLLSLRWTIRNVTGYEAFRKLHYVLAAVYMGACIGHWDALSCFLIPGLVLWGADRIARLARTWLLHYHYIEDEGTWAFRAAVAQAKVFGDDKHGDVVRLDLTRRQTPWSVGQHFYLCFVDGSVWQSHPFTPLNVPVADAGGEVTHSYLMRAKGGETRKVAEMLVAKAAKAEKDEQLTTSVILNGPYGGAITEGLAGDINVLCVAGGTGITYVLPVLLGIVRRAPRGGDAGRKVELVWAVKRAEDVEWVAPEMEELRRLGKSHGLVVRVFVTDGAASQGDASTVLAEKEVQVNAKSRSPSPSGSDAERATGRPDLHGAVATFVGDVAYGSTKVFGSGPPGMIGDLRAAVAKTNDAGKVLKGEERFDVSLVCDDRLEW